MKLDKADGTMDGTPTPCKANNTHCPELEYSYHPIGSHTHWSEKGRLHYHAAPNYGEYFYFTSKFKFSEEQLSPNNAFYFMLIHGPQTDEDITVDSFDFFLPSESSYPDPNDVCGELVQNGDAEGNGFNPYPFYQTEARERLIVVEEGGNKFFRLANRHHYRTSLKYRINTECLTRGVLYTFSAKVRFDHVGDFVGGAEPYVWTIWFRRSTNNQVVERSIAGCGPQSASDGWVTCTGDFVIDGDLSENTGEAYLLMHMKNERDGGKYNVDYDDISITYKQGYVDELVVDSEDVSCWGEGADTTVTSSIYYSKLSHIPNGVNTQIANIVDNGDGTTNIRLNEAAFVPIISQEENIDYAAEIAILSRNIKIEGDDDGEDNGKRGGYFQVIHTPGTAQTIVGVEFSNMGRRKQRDRYPLHLAYSGNVEGTLVSRNSFRKSNFRCIAIEGTSNVTVSHNVGHKTKGHCIYVGYESQNNLIQRNLVTETWNVGIHDQISGEGDYWVGAFQNLFHPNDYIDNIAVSSAT